LDGLVGHFEGLAQVVGNGPVVGSGEHRVLYDAGASPDGVVENIAAT
jgi:hypothetical protein